MQAVMLIVETLPETGVPFYDEPVTAVFNAADNAYTLHRCMCEEEQRDDGLPKCPECGSDSEFYRQLVETNCEGVLTLVDYLVCKNTGCENSKPPAAVVK